MKDKLTYYQICNLANQGLYGLIPSGYNIVWCGHKPEKVIDALVDGSCVTFTRNNFAQPHLVKVIGEYGVIIPEPPYDDFIEDYESEDGLLEYGDVLIRTKFFLSNFQFFYNTDKQKEFEIYKNKLTDILFDRNFIKKSDASFDCNIHIENDCWHIKGIVMTECTYPSPSCELNDNEIIEAKFSWDYFEREEIGNNQDNS